MNRLYGYTLEQCQDVVNGTTVYMTEYQIGGLECRPYSCLLDKVDTCEFGLGRAIIRPTCISGK